MTIARAIRAAISVHARANGEPQSSWRVSFAGTSQMCITSDAAAIVKTIAVALERPNPKRVSLVSLSIKSTRMRFSTTLIAKVFTFNANEIAPARMTPCINI
ncbi:MAG: hypothetical protein BWY50_02052 [Spirochaetes bacterium ADurb.Bin315]|nr:MAG: hypothetical protein BWY50_02052 [Spirochaetes bacterium ADurb.Bin315]